MVSIAWDDGTLPHPDERSTVAFYAPSIRWPGELKIALDPRRSTLNPFWDVNGGHRRSYTYGHFPLYTLVLTAGAAERLGPLADSLHLGHGSGDEDHQLRRGKKKNVEHILASLSAHTVFSLVLQAHRTSCVLFEF